MRDINLLPQELIKSREKKRRTVLTILLITCVLFFLTSIFFLIKYFDYQLDNKIRGVVDEMSSYEDVKQTLFNISSQEELIQNRKDVIEKIELESVDHNRLLSQLRNSIPNGMTLSEVSYDEEGVIVVRGTSKTESEIAIFMDNIAKINGIGNISLNLVEFNDSEQQNFYLQCQYSKEGVDK